MGLLRRKALAMGGSGHRGFRAGGGASSPARATAEVLLSPLGSRPGLARALLLTFFSKIPSQPGR